MARQAAEDDPLNAPLGGITPRGGSSGGLGASSSAPCLPSRPIDVFEQKKKNQFRNTFAGGEERDPNSLDRWLEAQSMASMTTATSAGTQMTTLSQKTKTSSGGPSICSEPGTTAQAAYRVHRRGIACNRKTWNAGNPFDAGALKDGIPGFGFPDSERFHTMFGDTYGHSPIGEQIQPAMYQSVFQNSQHPFVAKFLDSAAPDQKRQFAGMVRSLEYLRRKPVRATTTMMTEDMDLAENKRLWIPKKAKPYLDTNQLNLSKVPLGTAGFVQGKKIKKPPEAPEPPGSPSVSGLGSLPLSRLTTPATPCGGRDLPLASYPPPAHLETISEAVH
jgi:hypothetical protein